jgi:hypothetical protein
MIIIKGPAPLVIRNHRAHRWVNVVALGLLVSFSLVAWWAINAPLRVLPPKMVLPVAIGSLVSLFLLLVGLSTCRPVERLVLSEELLPCPPRLPYQPAQIREVSFGPDPHDDYAESAVPIRLCQAIVTPARGRAFNLIVSVGDAARLSGWAVARGITVHDAGGYSAR